MRSVLGGCEYRSWCGGETGDLGAGKRLMMVVVHVTQRVRAFGRHQNMGQWGERGFL